MRLYAPTSEVLTGKWNPPPVKRVSSAPSWAVNGLRGEYAPKMPRHSEVPWLYRGPRTLDGLDHPQHRDRNTEAEKDRRGDENADADRKGDRPGKRHRPQKRQKPKDESSGRNQTNDQQ